MKRDKINKFLQLSLIDKSLFTEVFFTLLISKIVIFFVPLRRSAKHFGVLNGESRQELSVNEGRLAQRVKLFIMMVSGNVPWNSVCLDQALATMIVLKRRKIPSSLCLGVLKNEEEGKIEAHAWIMCDSNILIGGQKSKRYTLVAQFACHFV